ncbi:hypothetical protein ACOMHN_039720 [Nucella lapillus]
MRTSVPDLDLLLSANEDGHVRVVHDVLTDAAHEGPSEHAHAPRARDDEVNMLLCCHFDHCLPWTVS